jgi:hypothetical protein
MTDESRVKNIQLFEYPANGTAVTTNHMGMRSMQERVYAQHQQRYLLVKSPPASGKSRALMYLGLEKLRSGAVGKVIVTVPERSIGKSFANTDLTSYGFHSNWEIEPQYDLCSPGVESGKVLKFKEFLKSAARILLCTHSTFRFAFQQVSVTEFGNCLIAVDEFHHVSVDEDNQLGKVLRRIMAETPAHVVAMTGSYFRGDSNSILSPEDESKFAKVTYNYYEQLSGYQYLKTLGISFAFYKGSYTDSISSVLDLTKKTIIHIPSVNAGESTKDKLGEVDHILKSIGDWSRITEDDIYILKSPDGRELKVADLVNDEPQHRQKVVSYLQKVSSAEDVDIIIALGMAKEGFDWPFCEVALTVGYRGSLTEIVQIIGRTTRDSPNKTHAQFINLVAEPDEARGDVVVSVNNVFKAIAASLLMEDVFVPRLKFAAQIRNDDLTRIVVKGFREPPTQRVKEIVEEGFVDLKAELLNNTEVQRTLAGGLDPILINGILIPKVVREIYPDLGDEEVESVTDHIVARAALGQGNVEVRDGKRFVKVADRMVDVDELNIELIYSINPFVASYEVVSKLLSESALRAIQTCIVASRIDVTDDEAVALWPEVVAFVRNQGKEPDRHSLDLHEQRLAEVLAYLRRMKNAV